MTIRHSLLEHLLCVSDESFIIMNDYNNNHNHNNNNLANAVVKNLMRCDEMPTSKIIPTRQTLHTSKKKQDSMLPAAITSKVEAGNFRAAVRLLCSEETVAPSNDDTFVALKAKHPAAPSDRRQAIYFKGNVRFLPLQGSPEEVMKSLKTFPAGSARGPDGLMAQHLLELLAGAADDKLKTNLSDFLNVVLQGVLPIQAADPLLYRRRMEAFARLPSVIRSGG